MFLNSARTAILLKWSTYGMPLVLAVISLMFMLKHQEFIGAALIVLLAALSSAVTRLASAGASRGLDGVSLECLEDANGSAVANRPSRSTVFPDECRQKNYWLSVVYEVRSALHAMLAFGDLCLDRGVGAEQRVFLESAKHAGERVNQLLIRAQQFINLNSREYLTSQVETDVRSLLMGVLEFVDQVGSRKGLSLSWYIDENLPQAVLLDPVLFRQALLDVLEYLITIAENGELALSVNWKSARQASPLLQIGITLVSFKKNQVEQDLKACASHSQSEVMADGAMRLWIAKTQIDLLKASLAISHDEGLRFDLTVPAGNVRSRALRGDENRSSPDVASIWQVHGVPLGTQVLIVEDNQVSRLVLREMLVRMGMHVREACSGIEALRLIKDNLFDVVLMDVLMPGMGGCEATGLIRSTPNGAQVPIVGMSADDREKSCHACLSAGMNEFVAKPIAPEILARAISVALLARRPIAMETKSPCGCAAFDLAKID